MEHIESDKKVDIRGLVCPYTFVKSKLAIEAMQKGQVLEILLDYEEASRNVPRSMQEQGQNVLSVDKINEKEWVIKIRKEKE